MNAATFEVLYSGFSRMHVQKTWEAIMNAPIALDDIVAAELVWAASKSCLAGVAILAVIAAFGFTASPLALAAIPVVFLTGLCFAALGLIMTALAPSYDFFMYYFTLFITPMTLLSGVFFPQSQLPETVRSIAEVLPLSHAIALVRPPAARPDAGANRPAPGRPRGLHDRRLLAGPRPHSSPPPQVIPP